MEQGVALYINAYTATIKWANQDDFIKQLTDAESNQNARQILHDKILEKYCATKSPLISFATDIAQEEEMFQKLLEPW